MSALSWARRIERATPPGRDRVVDGLRAFAMTGVVLGHWLVTGLALTASGALRNASPLSVLPGFAPVSWLLETLGLFFFAAGYAAARSSTRPGTGAGPARAGTGLVALGRRLGRLLPPVLVFLGVWVPTMLVLALAGAQRRTLWTVGKLAVSPLWFLAVLLGLTVLTPPAVAAVRRWGGWAAAAPLATVALVDLVRFRLWTGAPAAIGWVNVLAGWLVPYLLGIAVAQGRLRARGTGPALLVGGAVSALLLVFTAGYPASMVGVPGQGRSNLDPPSLVVVCLALAQIGAALCLWQRLAQLLRRPLAWAVVVLVNLAIFTVFLWHQTALILVTGVSLGVTGPLPGLVQQPTGAGWIVHRLLWLPAFLAALTGLCALFRRVERRRFGRRPAAATPGRPVPTTPHQSTGPVHQPGTAPRPVPAHRADLGPAGPAQPMEAGTPVRGAG